jgi:hypothetical protein
MEIELTPDLQAKLTRLAAESGRDTQAPRRRRNDRSVQAV